MRIAGLGLVLALALPGAVAAQDRAFRLSVPEPLAQSGLLDYVLPRFSLKTATRITQVPDGSEAEAIFGMQGGVAFEGLGQVWHLRVTDDADAQRFANWLRSDVGRNTVESFEVQGSALFTTDINQKIEVATLSFEGDASRGADLSLLHCGRCHVVSEANRMKAIGSTPSFAALRTLPDWDSRFQAFYALNPHPAFTQVADVTPPFEQSRPSPIVPVEITLDELEHILTFVAEIPPADLGARVRSR